MTWLRFIKNKLESKWVTLSHLLRRVNVSLLFFIFSLFVSKSTSDIKIIAVMIKSDEVARLNVTTSYSRFLFLALRWREGLTSPVSSLLMDKTVHKVNLMLSSLIVVAYQALVWKLSLLWIIPCYNHENSLDVFPPSPFKTQMYSQAFLITAVFQRRLKASAKLAN